MITFRGGKGNQLENNWEFLRVVPSLSRKMGELGYIFFNQLSRTNMDHVKDYSRHALLYCFPVVAIHLVVDFSMSAFSVFVHFFFPVVLLVGDINWTSLE